MTDSAGESAMQRARARVDKERAAGLLRLLLSAEAATGHEARAAELAAGWSRSQGLSARVQPLNPGQANVVVDVGSPGAGRTLLLCSPLDVMLDESDRHEGWMGRPVPAEVAPPFTRRGDIVVGHGASNPIGHAVACLEAAVALAGSNRAHPLPGGSLQVGLCAAGMPVGHGEPDAVRLGHGAGCEALLKQLGHPDAAIIAKPGRTVSCEEVGLNWFTIDVIGAMTYTGTRHRGSYANPILVAGELIAQLELWFAEYTSRFGTGTLSPQGAVAAVRAGWQDTAAFGAPVLRLLLDVRSTPDTDHAQIMSSLGKLAAAFERGHPPFSLEVTPSVSVPGSRTEPDAEIVSCSVRAWELVTGKAPQPRTGASGATDANILRGAGVPTVRIGMPNVTSSPLKDAFPAAMNTVNLDDICELAQMLIAVSYLYLSGGRTSRTGVSS